MGKKGGKNSFNNRTEIKSKDLISCKEIIYPQQLSYRDDNKIDIVVMRVEKQIDINPININIIKKTQIRGRYIWTKSLIK